MVQIKSGLFCKFIDHKTDRKERAKEGKKPLNENIQKEYVRYFDSLIEIMGDEPISDITRKVLKDAILTYGNLPKRNLKKYKGEPVLELLEKDIPEEARLQPGATKQVAKLVQGIFSYAVEAELLNASPAHQMKLKLNATCTFASYSDKEVTMILASAFKESELWKKWLPPLAAYTGARRGELVQLRKQDVKWDSDAERYYILITDQDADMSIKSENAKRQVPLHDALIDKGFLEYADSAGDRLFGDLKPQAVTKWFTAYRDRLGIERFDDYGNRKVFHSFRHSFITKARGKGSGDMHVQQVVGHEKTGIGTTDRYSHNLPLKDVLGVVDCVEYE